MRGVIDNGVHRFRVTEQCRLDHKYKQAGRHSRVDRKSLLDTCREEALFMQEQGKGRRRRRRQGDEEVKNAPLTITVRRGPVCPFRSGPARLWLARSSRLARSFPPQHQHFLSYMFYPD